jgi:HD-GYP domain-containing protein (c-di-GMP phosphodiesterase class II)
VPEHNGKDGSESSSQILKQREQAKLELQKRTYRYLKRSVSGQVAIRIAVTAVALGALLGAATYGYLWRELQETVLEYGKSRLAPMIDQVRHLIESGDPSDAERWVNDLMVRRKEAGENKKGRFVYVAVYDNARKQLARATAPDFQSTESWETNLSQITDRVPQAGEMVSKRLSIGGQPCILLADEVKNTAGRGIGFVEGVFELDPQILAAGRQKIFRNMLMVIGIVLLTAVMLYPVGMGLMNRLTRAVVRLMQSHFEVLTVLSGAIAKRDSDTSEHNFRVTIMAVRLAEAAGLEGGALRGLFKGALIHDVGKIGVHDAILLKEGRLTDSERQEMQKHVEHGWEIVRDSPWLMDGADVVRYHHEKYDGSGYPEGLAGERIPQSARIFAIVDVFDALVARRPYKAPMPLEQALTILRQGRGSHFDPVFLDLFLGNQAELCGGLHSKSPVFEKSKIESELVRIAAKYFVSLDEALSF